MGANVKPPFGVTARRGLGLACDLLGAWLFNEGTGSLANDACGNGYDGSFLGSAGWSSGAHGFCLAMPTSPVTGDNVLIGNRKPLSQVQVPLTILARFMLYSSTGANVLLGQYLSSGSSRLPKMLRVDSGVLKYWCNKSDGGIQSFTGPSVSVGVWHTAGAVVSGSIASPSVALFFDGAWTSGILLAMSSTPDTSVNVRIAGDDYGDTSRGQIDHVYVWGRALSVGEVRQAAWAPYALVGRRASVEILGVREVTERSVSGTIAAESSASVTATVSHASDRPTGASWPRVTLETENAWHREALLNGQTEAGWRLGTVLTQGWFWVRRSGCTAVYRSDDADPCHAGFGSPVAVASNEDNAIRVSNADIGPDTTQCYVVRRFNGCGAQDRTMGAAAVVHTGADGQLATPAPNPIFGLRVSGVGGRRLRLVWSYSPLDERTSPQAFGVYWDGGTGQIDFASPLAVAPYEGRGLYSHITSSLSPGRYQFAVRAQAAGMAEGPSRPHASVDVDAATPVAPTVIAVEVGAS